MRKSALILLSVLFLLVLVLPVAAQETGPIDLERIVRPGAIVTEIVALLGVFAAGVGPLAQAVTSIYKFIAARWWTRGLDFLPTVALLVPVALTALFWAADAFGLSDLYITVGNQLVEFVPVALSMLGAILGQAVTYQTFKKADVPLVGKTRAQLIPPAG